jgi:hypothetical protein
MVGLCVEAKMSNDVYGRVLMHCMKEWMREGDGDTWVNRGIGYIKLVMQL